MIEINAVHDKTFKNVMKDLRVAQDFFKQYLPEKITSLLDLNSLLLCANSYVDEKLNELRSDILYQVNFKESDDIGFIYILAEHQSTVDVLLPYRLWHYIFCIWNDYLKKTKKTMSDEPKKLPLVIPLVFYNGKTAYTASTNLRDIIDGPAELVEDILFKNFLLVDTHDIQDEDLQKQHWSAVMTYVFKHIMDRDFWPNVNILIKLIKKIEHENSASIYILDLLKYVLLKGNMTKTPQEFIETLQNGLAASIKGEIMTLAEQLIEQGEKQGIQIGIQQGVQQGIQQGVQQGVHQGESKLLLLQLEQKFHSIPEHYRQWIQKADPEMLLRWGIKVLESDEIDEVFK